MRTSSSLCRNLAFGLLCGALATASALAAPRVDGTPVQQTSKPAAVSSAASTNEQQAQKNAQAALAAQKATEQAQVEKAKLAQSSLPQLAQPSLVQPLPPLQGPAPAPAPLPAPGIKPAPAPQPAPGIKPSPDPSQDPVDPNSKARITYEFGTDTKNFGKVMQGDVLNFKFQLKSSGEEDLVIKQAKPTCGCTVAQIACEQADGTLAPYVFGNPIAPGRKIEISATLHTQNKRGHAGSRINIFTNDPRGQTQLGLEADVDPFFQINPTVINFNNLSSKDTATDKATISTTRGEKIKLTIFKDNMPQGLKVDLNALDADAEGKATRWELVSTAGPGLLEGNLAFAVPMRSDLSIPGAEKLPNGAVPTYEASLTIMGHVTGLISFNPAFLSLGLLKPGQVKTATIRVTSHDPDFKLGDLKCEIQGRDTPEWEYKTKFDTFVKPVAGENSVDIEVRLNGMPESLNGSFSGKLVVKIGHPEKPQIELPITGVCRGGGGPDAGGTTPPK